MPDESSFAVECTKKLSIKWQVTKRMFEDNVDAYQITQLKNILEFKFLPGVSIKNLKNVAELVFTEIEPLWHGSKIN